MENCELCGGTGYIETNEQVYANEPHYANIGEKKCECTINEE